MVVIVFENILYNYILVKQFFIDGEMFIKSNLLSQILLISVQL